MAKRISEEETIVNFFTTNGNTPKGETVFNIVKGIMRKHTAPSKTKSSGTKTKSKPAAQANSAPAEQHATESSNLPM